MIIDGSYGEGGGQIVRTALALAAISGRSIRIENIRARRKIPGLAAQHLTGVRAIAQICNAQVTGDELGSQTLTFAPGGPPQAGDYLFDVAEAREGGSAGATTLILHTILLPLAMAQGDSTVTIRGGTHVAWSPPFDYAQHVWLPTLGQMGIQASVDLVKWGWYPAGEGEIQLSIKGLGPNSKLKPLWLTEPGQLQRVWGRAVAANLPSHIPQRMTDRARSLLAETGIQVQIEPARVRAACAGAGIFLTAEYEHVRAGFSTLGAKGKASEAVAEEAVSALLDHRQSGDALDKYLADQLVLPLALTGNESGFTVEDISRHLTTTIWLVEQFNIVTTTIEGRRFIIQPLTQFRS
jgi:RNA 3'-terminal phosphate cyclase (ATP)